ncbi:MAG: response regulator transcription factor [Halanaerobiales bacterium]|nr:response regulator transcription factor [Halanaerobiales bacterium]
MKLIVAVNNDKMKKSLEEYLNSVDEIEKIWCVNNYNDLKQIGLGEKIDLLITDIALEGENGYVIIKELSQKNKMMKVIFYTTVSILKCELETSIKGFELADFVVLQEMGLEWLHRVVVEQLKESDKIIQVPEKILITNNETIFFLNPEDIIFVEKVNKQLVFHMVDKILNTSGTLSDMERRLPFYFYRSHRSYLINLHQVEKLILFGRSYQVEFRGTDQKTILSYDRRKVLVEMLL